MFTPEERAQLRDALIAAARTDPRLTGAALTGSAAAWAEDRWSDPLRPGGEERRVGGRELVPDVDDQVAEEGVHEVLGPVGRILPHVVAVQDFLAGVRVALDAQPGEQADAGLVPL